MSSKQNAYVINRCISEGDRLISDLPELNKEGFSVTVHIENTFDPVNHVLSIAILEEVGFGITFLEWIKTFLNSQEQCVVSRGKTSKYFKLERGARQGDPISAYLLIIVLEVVFQIIKEHQMLKVLKFFTKNLSTLLILMIMPFS